MNYNYLTLKDFLRYKELQKSVQYWSRYAMDEDRSVDDRFYSMEMLIKVQQEMIEILIKDREEPFHE